MWSPDLAPLWPVFPVTPGPVQVDIAIFARSICSHIDPRNLDALLTPADQDVSGDLRFGDPAPGSDGVMPVGRARSLPSRKVTPARNQGDQMRCVDGLPTGVCSVDELVGQGPIPAPRDPGPLVTLVRNRTVANVESMVFWNAVCDSCGELQVCVVEPRMQPAKNGLFDRLNRPAFDACLDAAAPPDGGGDSMWNSSSAVTVVVVAHCASQTDGGHGLGADFWFDACSDPEIPRIVLLTRRQAWNEAGWAARNRYPTRPIRALLTNAIQTARPNRSKRRLTKLGRNGVCGFQTKSQGCTVFEGGWV